MAQTKVNWMEKILQIPKGNSPAVPGMMACGPFSTLGTWLCEIPRASQSLRSVAADPSTPGRPASVLLGIKAELTLSQLIQISSTFPPLHRGRRAQKEDAILC